MLCALAQKRTTKPSSQAVRFCVKFCVSASGLLPGTCASKNAAMILSRDFEIFEQQFVRLSSSVCSNAFAYDSVQHREV